MATFFTSDTHYGHENVRVYSHRPFFGVEDMDVTMVARCNDVCGPEDTLYHLGDFVCGVGPDKASYAAKVRVQLRVGKLVLIRGNHDPLARNEAFNAVFDEVHDLLELKVKGIGQPFVLCHYALKVWHNSHLGAYHLYGHSHGSLKDDGSRSMDVGVDCHAYTPVSALDIAAKLNARKPPKVDHHNERTT